MDHPARPVVLVCDDELGPRLSLEMILDGKCEIVSTEAASQALEALRTRRFDCAVVDWSVAAGRLSISSMAVDNTGAQLLQQIHAIDQTLSVVVWSAYGSTIQATAKAAGAFAICSKPKVPTLTEILAASAATSRNRSA